MNQQNTIPKHEILVCPRCGIRFECKAGTITECQCLEVKLTPFQMERIRKKYTGCLCKNCLAKLAKDST